MLKFQFSKQTTRPAQAKTLFKCDYHERRHLCHLKLLLSKDFHRKDFNLKSLKIYLPEKATLILKNPLSTNIKNILIHN